MATDDERDRVEETPSVDSTAKSPREASADGAPADQVAAGSDDLDAADGELEVDDPEALERATERVSEAGLDDELDDGAQVEEPTDAELAALTEPTDDSDDHDSESDDPESDDAESDAGSTEDRELVEVGAASGRTGGKAKTAKQSTKKKGRATPKRDDRAPAHKRTGPVTFVKESIGELRKVVYPTGPQLLNYFIVVLIFVLFIIAIVSVLDLAFGWAILKLFS